VQAHWGEQLRSFKRHVEGSALDDEHSRLDHGKG
jgi:hypothetical protein